MWRPEASQAIQIIVKIDPRHIIRNREIVHDHCKQAGQREYIAGLDVPCVYICIRRYTPLAILAHDSVFLAIFPTNAHSLAIKAHDANLCRFLHCALVRRSFKLRISIIVEGVELGFVSKEISLNKSLPRNLVSWKNVQQEENWEKIIKRNLLFNKFHFNLFSIFPLLNFPSRY